MAFTLPTFNVPVNVFHGHNETDTPPYGAPDIAGVLANVSLGRRGLIGTDSASTNRPVTGVGVDVMFRIMMFPAATDIRGPFQDVTIALSDFIEMPAGSGAFYFVQDVADMAKGFPNEHRVAWTTPSQWVTLPTPLP